MSKPANMAMTASEHGNGNIAMPTAAAMATAIVKAKEMAIAT